MPIIVKTPENAVSSDFVLSLRRRAICRYGRIGGIFGQAVRFIRRGGDTDLQLCGKSKDPANYLLAGFLCYLDQKDFL